MNLRSRILLAALALGASSGALAAPPVITAAGIGAGPNWPSNFQDVIVNLRVQGVVTGAAPINITAGQFIVNGQVDNLLGASIFPDANNTICLVLSNLDSNAGPQDNIQLQITATNAQNESTSALVQITQKNGPFVDPQNQAEVTACTDPFVNTPPTANAGPDQSAPDTDGAGGETVTLNGLSSTDADGTIVSYIWSNAAGQQIATGANPTAKLPDGANTVTLTVMDNNQATATDTVVITVGAPRMPVANAGPDQNVADTDKLVGEKVNLNGSGSSDPDGTLVSYVWRLGQTQIATGATPQQVPLPDGQNVITLTVTDNSGLTATDQVVINVATAPKATVLGNLPGLDKNQKSMADALDSLCGRVLGGTQTIPDSKGRQSQQRQVRPSQATAADQADLAAKCNGLLFNNTAQNQVTALDELSPKDFAAARTQTLLFANFQYTGIMERLMALRGGARGLSLAGLNLTLDGSHVPLAQVERMTKQLLGGGASADQEKGGLLSDKWGLWARGNYSFGSKDRTASSPKFDADQFGLLGGLDYRFTDNFVAGVSLGYGDSKVDFASDDGQLKTKTWSVSMYASTYAAKNFYLDGLLNVGNGKYTADRNITYSDGVGLVSADAKGDTDGLTWSGALSLGYDFVVGGFTLSPNIGTYYVDTTIDKFTESGAGGLNLSYDKQNYQSFTGSAGFRATFAWNVSWGVILPHLRTDYVHEFHNDVEVFGVHFDADPDSASPPILIRTDNPDKSYLRLAAGFAAQFKGGVSGYIDYQRLVGYESITFQDVSVGLRFQKSF